MLVARILSVMAASSAEGAAGTVTVNPPGAALAADVLSAHSASWLLRWARMQLADSSPGGALGPPPASVKAPVDTTVFLTVYSNGQTASFRGQDNGLLGATTRAVSAGLDRQLKPDRLQLDIVAGEPAPLPRPPENTTAPDPIVREAWRRLTSFQDGLVVAHGEQAYWLVASQLLLQGMARARRDIDPARPADMLAAAMRALGWPPDAWRDPSVELWSFQTASWIEDATHERAVRLTQGVMQGSGATRERMVAAAVAGGEYLLRVQHEDGSYMYSLDPWLQTQSRNAYNIVRHSGTTAALFELHAATGDRRFLAAGLRGIEYQTRWYRLGQLPGLTYVLDRDGKGKLGALGLALLALTRKLDAVPDNADRDHALALARQIVAMQHPDGSFESYLPIKGTEPPGSVSLYYPGEAMLGLARLAQLGLDEGGTFRSAAHRGADFLIELRRGKDRLPPDAWLMQALDVLYDDDPKPSYVEHALAISRSMLADQYGDGAPPAYLGSFGPEPIRSTRTTARVEGLVSAHRLAVKAGDDRAPSLLAAMVRTVPHLLQLQYTPDNSFFLARPDLALGGIRGGHDDAEIRIDYVQHHISAMLGLASLLE